MPVANLLHPQPGKPWRATNPAQAVVTVNLGGILATLGLPGWDTVFLGYAKAPIPGATARFKVEASSSSGGLSSPSLSSGWIDFRCTSDIDSSWPFVHSWWVASGLRSEQWLRITLDFPGASQVTLSQLLVDAAYVPSLTIAPGLGTNYVEAPRVVESLGGSRWPQARPIRRSMPWTVQSSGPGAPAELQGQLARLQRENGESNPMAVIFDDAPTTYAMDKISYGTLKQTGPLPLAMPDFGLWTVPFEMTEW